MGRIDPTKALRIVERLDFSVKWGETSPFIFSPGTRGRGLYLTPAHPCPP